MLTLHQLWGVASPADAERKLAEARVPCETPRNLEEWILAQVGSEIYERSFKVTRPSNGDAIRNNLPHFDHPTPAIRSTYDDRYFDDPYEGIPAGGYTRMFENMLDHPNIRFETGVDFFAHRTQLQSQATTLVYTGKIDEFFDCRFGPLALPVAAV